MSPVHLRVEPGDFAESVLLPGDPLRATIVPEELIQLGAKNLLRAGTCGGYDPGLRLGDLIVATAATPQDGTVSSITRGVPDAPAAHFDVVHAAEGVGRRTSVGPIASSDLFYDLTEKPTALWTTLGVLAVEREVAAIFAMPAMRGVRVGCLPTVSDTIGAEVVWIGDDELRSAVDNMMTLALDKPDALN